MTTLIAIGEGVSYIILPEFNGILAWVIVSGEGLEDDPSFKTRCYEA